MKRNSIIAYGLAALALLPIAVGVVNAQAEEKDNEKWTEGIYAAEGLGTDMRMGDLTVTLSGGMHLTFSDGSETVKKDNYAHISADVGEGPFYEVYFKANWLPETDKFEKNTARDDLEYNASSGETYQNLLERAGLSEQQAEEYCKRVCAGNNVDKRSETSSLLNIFVISGVELHDYVFNLWSDTRGVRFGEFGGKPALYISAEQPGRVRTENYRSKIVSVPQTFLCIYDPDYHYLLCIGGEGFDVEILERVAANLEILVTDLENEPKRSVGEEKGLSAMAICVG